ncbi:hypothetical protein AVEN_83968-1 [Araneus ventricosus]|uniref:Uncharacterized protein n=1 Tax=Araneus ventricosus TaxID=182803 RepID=A0A4Y2BSI7_ARAVE|nr:hypothetical protein AVEN_83968-1 [Araneus ventricosus]
MHIWLFSAPEHDGEPAHRTSSVTQYQVEEFGKQIIGYGGFQEWPPRSLDLTPMYFFLWRYLKQQCRSKLSVQTVRGSRKQNPSPNYIEIHARERYPGHGGLMVRSRPRDRRVAGSKPDSTKYPPCMGPVASQIIRSGQMSSRWRGAGAWRRGASPAQVPYLSSDCGSKLRGSSLNSPRVASKQDVNIN